MSNLFRVSESYLPVCLCHKPVYPAPEARARAGHTRVVFFRAPRMKRGEGRGGGRIEKKEIYRKKERERTREKERARRKKEKERNKKNKER